MAKDSIRNAPKFYHASAGFPSEKWLSCAGETMASATCLIHARWVVPVEPAGAACALNAVPDVAGAFSGWVSGMVRDVALSCGLAEDGAKAAVKARIAGTTRRVAGVKLRSFIELQLSFLPPELSQEIRFKHINPRLSALSGFGAM